MADQPLSILHVLAPADSGGLETVVRSLAAGHVALGHRVDIAAVVDNPGSVFVTEARDSGLHVHVIASPARSFRPERRGVQELLAAHGFNVMHSHGYRADILDIGVARAMHVPSVTTLHGFSATDRKARTYEWLQLRAAHRASAMVAVSTNVKDRLLRSGANPESVHLIRNALTGAARYMRADDARAALGLPRGRNIAWIGRLSREKGPDVMLEAALQLGKPAPMLSFLGDGPDRTLLSERAAQAAMGGNVKFHGRVQDAANFLHAFDALVLSSRTEGTPMVVLEAMAAGVPIVATRVGGIPDMLSESEAMLVDPDDPAALAAAINATLANPAASAARAERAKARLLRDFDATTWLAQYERLYRSIQPRSSE